MKKILLSLLTLFTATTSAFAGDIITNGGFESWTDGACDGWKSTTTASSATLIQSEEAHSGTYAVQINGGLTSNKRLGSQEYTLQPGLYKMKAYVKGADAKVALGYVNVKDNGAVGSYSYGGEFETTGEEWTEVTYDFSITTETKVNFVLNNKGSKSQKSGTILIDDFSVDFSEVVAPNPEGEGTLENPYNSVAAANEAAKLASGASSESEVYVKGKVASITTAYSSSYKNISFTVSPDGTANGAFLCFRVSSEEDPNLKVGDEVVVCGKLMNYSGTPETAAGGTIYSINGTTTGISTVATSANKAQVIYSLDGRRLAKPERGVNIINGKKVIVL